MRLYVCVCVRVWSPMCSFVDLFRWTKAMELTTSIACPCQPLQETNRPKMEAAAYLVEVFSRGTSTGKGVLGKDLYNQSSNSMQLPIVPWIFLCGSEDLWSIAPGVTALKTTAILPRTAPVASLRGGASWVISWYSRVAPGPWLCLSHVLYVCC